MHKKGETGIRGSGWMTDYTPWAAKGEQGSRTLPNQVVFDRSKTPPLWAGRRTKGVVAGEGGWEIKVPLSCWDKWGK